MVLCVFSVRLRCTGVDPDDHRVKSEIVCVNLVALDSLVLSLSFVVLLMVVLDL